jgi:ADP-dependent NAD(P)H-hydrate dehydratase / NAD(P)H-hydrate epimerase
LVHLDRARRSEWTVPSEGPGGERRRPGTRIWEDWGTVPTARSSDTPPLPGCTPLFGAAAMREADRRASGDHRIPSILLMERAGLAAAREILAAYPARRRAVVAVGRGNNGGDGMVVARHLAEARWEVAVVSADGAPPGDGDAGVMTEIAGTLGIRAARADSPEVVWDGAVVVDALLGTGAQGAPRAAEAAVIGRISSAGGPVVALDLPSGVEADTGRVAGAAVRAEITVTFHGDMPGLRVAPGAGHAGRVVVADIGIPGAVAVPAAAWLSSEATLAAAPRKAATSDKYGSGAVLVIGGSPGLTGAPCLTARATLRAGAGLAVAAVPAAVQAVVAGHLTEVMSAALPDEDGHLAPASVEEAVRQSGRAGAVALGPGLGRAEATTRAVRALLERLERPLVLDADGLWHLGADPVGALAARPAPTVLTPHAGEAGRLLGWERTRVEAERLAAASALAEATGAVVVLKGAGTIVARPGGAAVVDSVGTPALATAGTGDVLTGVVAAFLAAGLPPADAAALAVVAHGRAGALAGAGDGTVASDVVEALPRALAGRGG